MKTGSILTQPVKDQLRKLAQHEDFNLERNWEIYNRVDDGESPYALIDVYKLTGPRIYDIYKAMKKKLSIIKKQELVK